jgi:hypothetical protein
VLDLTVADVVNIAFSPEGGGQERLENLFGWRRERAMAQVTWVVSTAGIVLSPLLAAVFDNEVDISRPTYANFFVGSALVLAYGAHRIHQLRRLEAEYVQALHLYLLARRIALRELPGAL